MNFTKVVVSHNGGPEVLQIVEEELRPPRPGEVRIRTLAASVTLPDVEARYGRSPFPPKYPFTPGYAVVGTIDAIGTGVSHAKPGDTVAALTVYGGYSEYVYWPERKLIPVPATLDPMLVVPLILNYIVAYQTMHRFAKVRRGDKVLFIGASGGIGTAYLQLGKAAGLTMYGLASGSKHAALKEFGAKLIDYRTQDFVECIRKMEPNGVDVVFDGIGGEYLRRGLPLLKPGGAWVWYANPTTLRQLLILFANLIWRNLFSGGRSLKLYGTGASLLDFQPFLEDWAILFSMLRDGKISPVIAATFPLREADKANALLESGQVVGNIVLLSPALPKR